MIKEQAMSLLLDYVEGSEDLGLFVVAEEDNETLLLHCILSKKIQSFHGGILSFQETTGCTYIWDHICSLQRNVHFGSHSNHLRAAELKLHDKMFTRSWWIMQH